MPSEFRLAALGADMDEGTLLEWHVAPGARVKRGDVVAVVETDKGAIYVEIFMDGVVREIVVPPGTKVPVGTVLALVDIEGAAVPAPSPAEAGEDRGEGRAKITPAARRRARELQIDLASVTGTGPDGAVTIEDVERAKASPPAPSPSAQSCAAKAVERAGDGERMREAIAAAMSRSKREIPHYYLAHTIDVKTPLERLLASNSTT